MHYDFFIVGAGLYGATFARVATDLGKKCLVIDKLPYVGGTAADEQIENIWVSKHGGHVFHCNDKLIWDFLNQFTKFNNFINRAKAIANDKVWSFPINLMTLNQLWGVKTPKEAIIKLKEVRKPYKNPKNFEEWALSMVGEELYHLFYYNYTKLQWQKEPQDLPASIIKRLPIRLTYDENYFSTIYQGMPLNGYTKMMENMLDGIDLTLEVDFMNLEWKKYGKKLVYSGSIDKLFDYEHGKLDYRTMRFERKIVNGDFQGNATINYCDGKEKYVRTVEHKHCYKPSVQHYTIDKSKSVISYDIPIPYDDSKNPYYPLQDDKNTKIYNLYKNIAKKEGFIVGGRLGTYRYLDLDQVCAMAIKDAKKWCK